MGSETKKDVKDNVQEVEASGVAAESSPAALDETSTSSSVTEPSLAEVARKAYEASQASDESKEPGQSLTESGENDDKPQDGEASEEATPDDGTVEKAETEETAEGEEPQAESEAETNYDPKDPDANLPFGKHPRWKEVITQKQKLEEEVKQVKATLVQHEQAVKQHQYHADFCNRHGIQPQEVAAMMNVLAFSKSNPAKALEILKPFYSTLNEFSDDLPGDLAQRVSDGEMTEEVAKELHTLRRSAKTQTLSQRSTQQSSEQQAQAQAQATQRAKTAALESWESNMRRLDPSFKPKVDPSAPDGLLEVTAAKYAFLLTQEDAPDAHAAVQLLERAYKEAKRVVRPAMLPKPKVPSSMRSSVSKRPEPKTFADIASNVAAEHGIQWDSRGRDSRSI